MCSHIIYYILQYYVLILFFFYVFVFRVSFLFSHRIILNFIIVLIYFYVCNSVSIKNFNLNISKYFFWVNFEFDYQECNINLFHNYFQTGLQFLN